MAKAEYHSAVRSRKLTNSALAELLLEDNMDFVRAVMASSATQVIVDQLTQITLEYMLTRENLFPYTSYDRYTIKLRFAAGGLTCLCRDRLAGKTPLTLDQLTVQAEDLLTQLIKQASQ